MLRFTAVLGLALCGVAAASAGQGQSGSNAAVQDGRICRQVVDHQPGAKPYELCLTEAEWDAKKKADAKNPNRTVCRYQAAPGSRFKSYKVCMTAAEWENQRQLERQAIEQIQRNVCVPGAGC
jgi:hypothetical protein